MIRIPREYFKNDTVHRSIGSDLTRGIVSCGFINQKHNSPASSHIVFEYYGALLLLSGEGTHIDSEGREYRLTPGCFVQRIPGKPHATYVKTDGNWLEFFICFGRGVFESLAEINVLTARQDVLYPGVNMAIFSTFTSFMAALKAASEEELPMLLNEVQRIILTIYRMHWRNDPRHKDTELIRLACQLLGDPRARITARDTALQLGVGYEKFRKLFRERVGASPGAYAIQSRINAAKSRLLETGDSVKEIALGLGFPDAFTFSKQFRQVVGVPPSEYKSMH